MSQPRSIFGALSQVAGKAIGRDWPLYATMLDHWREIVGLDLADATTPVKLTFPHNGKREGGTLTLRLPRGLALEMQYRQEQIRARINGFFGAATIARIVLEPVTGAPPPARATPDAPIAPEKLSELENQVAILADEELREAALALGKAMALDKRL